MDVTPATPTSKSRPHIHRSHTAKADLSSFSNRGPLRRVETATSQFRNPLSRAETFQSRNPLGRVETSTSQHSSKKHHLDFLHGHGHRRAENKASHGVGPSRLDSFVEKVKAPSPRDSTIEPAAKPATVAPIVVVTPVDVEREQERCAQRDE